MTRNDTLLEYVRHDRVMYYEEQNRRRYKYLSTLYQQQLSSVSHAGRLALGLQYKVVLVVYSCKELKYLIQHLESRSTLNICSNT